MLARGLAGLLMSTLIRLAKAEAFGRPRNIHCAWKEFLTLRRREPPPEGVKLETRRQTGRRA